MFKSVKDVRAYCEKNKIEMIDFKMIDIKSKYK